MANYDSINPDDSDPPSIVVPDERTPLINATDGSALEPGGNKDNFEDPNRPKGIRFAVLFACILLGNFLSGYEASCIETLAPVITDRFHALGDVGWYGISYLLASCATMLMYGQLYSYFAMKDIFVGSMLIFVAGTAISATAQSSPVFIAGRAVSGLGSAGVYTGGSIIIANTTPLKHRPIYQAIAGGVECTAAAFGPVISGAIAQYWSWRGAYYIMIPIAMTGVCGTLLFVHGLQRPENAHLTRLQKLKRLDFPGLLIYAPMTITLVLGLQWAGVEYSWDDWRIILLLTMAGVFVLTFLAWEYKAGDDSMFPLAMLRQRSVGLACLFTFCNMAAVVIVTFYLPIYLQAVRGATTLESGFLILPFAASLGIAITLAGPLTSLVGYYSPFMVCGSIMMAVATGLMTTFNLDTLSTKLIFYQIIYGAGVGLAHQGPYTAVQTVLPEPRVPTALVTLTFAQEFGAILSLSVAQNIFVDQLSLRLVDLVPGLDRKAILQSGALGVINKVPPELRHQVLSIYSDVLSHVFFIAVPMAFMTVIGAVGIEWKSVKDEKRKEGVDDCQN